MAGDWTSIEVGLVLQGGGALGAYQAGVYQALSEAGIEPEWVIGTSIGAIVAGDSTTDASITIGVTIGGASATAA